MSAPSRTEIFGEVIDLRQQLDAIRRAYNDDDVEAIGDVLAGDDLDDEDEDDQLDDDLEDDELDD